MRIVIADDSDVVRQRLIRLITDLDGLEVVGQAADVPEARDMVQALRPDVAILDLRMPSGSGADLVTDIKQRKGRDGSSKSAPRAVREPSLVGMPSRPGLRTVGLDCDVR